MVLLAGVYRKLHCKAGMAQIRHGCRLVCNVKDVIPLTVALRYLLVPSGPSNPYRQQLCASLTLFPAIPSLLCGGRSKPNAFAGSCDAQLFCSFSAWQGKITSFTNLLIDRLTNFWSRKLFRVRDQKKGLRALMPVICSSKLC